MPSIELCHAGTVCSLLNGLNNWVRPTWLSIDMLRAHDKLINGVPIDQLAELCETQPHMHAIGRPANARNLCLLLLSTSVFTCTFFTKHMICIILSRIKVLLVFLSRRGAKTDMLLLLISMIQSGVWQLFKLREDYLTVPSYWHVVGAWIITLKISY